MKLLQAITPVAMKITPATMKTNASTTSAALEVSWRETMFLIGPSSTRPPIAITANDAPHRMTGVGRIVTPPPAYEFARIDATASYQGSWGFKHYQVRFNC